MTDLQTNKYMYKSEVDSYATEQELDELRQNIDDIIDNKWNDALNTSGYIADCILKAKKFFTIRVETVSVETQDASANLSYNRLIVGEEGKTSTFFIPNGVGSYVTKTLEGELYYSSSLHDDEISSSKVVDGNFVILLDYTDSNNPIITSAPMRITDDLNNYWQYFFARPTQPELVESKPIWWDTTNNVIRQYDDINGWNNNTIKQYSIPLGIVHLENDTVQNIVQDFNISGYSDETIWVNPNILFGIADGRNEDSAINIITTTSGITDGQNKYPEYVTVDITEHPVNQTNTYSTYDTISTLTLNSICRDARTLLISKNTPLPPEGTEDNIIASDYYNLGADMLTITFNPELANIEKLYIRYYEQPYTIPVFVSYTGELLPPETTKDFTYNSNLGYYVNANNEKQLCCRLGVYSLGYVAKKSLWTNEKLSIINYYSKQRSLLTDTEDVRFLIESYSAEFVEAISIALNKAGNADEDLQSLRAEILTALDRAKQNIVDVTGESSQIVPSGGSSSSSATLEKLYDETEIVPVGVKIIARTPKTGKKAALDLTNVSINQILIDGKYNIKAITYNNSYISREDNTSYGIGTQFNIPGYNTFSFRVESSREMYIDDSDNMGVAIESAEGLNKSGVTNSTDVRVGRNYIKANTTYTNKLYLGGSQVFAFAGTGSSSNYTLIAPISYNADLFNTTTLSGTSNEGYIVDFSTTSTTDELIKADDKCGGVISSKTLMYNNTSLQTVTIPDNAALVAFSGKTSIRVLGRVNKGDKLYLWNKNLRTHINSTIKEYMQQVTGITSTALNNMLSITGCAISETFINELKNYNSTIFVAYFNDNLHKCIGIATTSTTTPSYNGTTKVNAIVSMNFENNKSINDIKRELGILV